MKTSDEMISSLLERRDRFEAEKKQKRKKAVVSLTAFGCVGLIALSTLGIMHFTKKTERSDAPPVTAASKETTDAAATVDAATSVPVTSLAVTTTEKKIETVWGDSRISGVTLINSSIHTSTDSDHDNNIYPGRAVNKAVTLKKNTALEGNNIDRFPLYEQYLNADDDTLFALNVSFSYNDRQDAINAIDGELWLKYGTAEDNGGLYNELSVQLTAAYKKLMKKFDITVSEAYARARYEPEYKEAVKKLHDNHLAWYKEKLTRMAELDKEELDYLFENCASVICSCYSDSEGAISYLSRYNSLAIVLISKAQIKELEGSGYQYIFSLADNQFERYRMQSLYYAPDGEYSEDKISKAASDAFEKANGKKVTVNVSIGLPEREKDEFDLKYSDEYQAEWNRALAKFGMTYEEYLNGKGNELSSEQMQELHEYKEALTSRKAEFTEVVLRIFRDGEVMTDPIYWNCNLGYVTASVTYERALELAAEWNVVSISLTSDEERAYYNEHNGLLYENAIASN